MIPFGDNVLLWRLYRSLSQAQLSAMTGIPRPNLSDIENGKRDVTLNTILSLANALGVSPGNLVDGKSPEYEKRKESFTRESMERIAESVARGMPPKNSTEFQIYSLLRDVLRSSLQRIQTASKKLPLPTRRGNRAWLFLRTLYPAEIINSLIERSIEHAERERL